METAASLYPVNCGCGHVNHVPLQKAGTDVPCEDSGGTLLVPALSKLKQETHLAAVQLHEIGLPSIGHRLSELEIQGPKTRELITNSSAVLRSSCAVVVNVAFVVLIWKFVDSQEHTFDVRKTPIADEFTKRQSPFLPPDWAGTWSGKFEGDVTTPLGPLGGLRTIGARPIPRGSISVVLEEFADSKIKLRFRPEYAKELSHLNREISCKVVTADGSVVRFWRMDGTMRRTVGDDHRETAELQISWKSGSDEISIRADLKRSI